jgi:hypothetical protein
MFILRLDVLGNAIHQGKLSPRPGVRGSLKDSFGPCSVALPPAWPDQG